MIGTAARSRPLSLAAFDPLLVAIVAFAIRMAHAAFVAQTPLFEGRIIDAHVYWTFAEHLAATGDLGGSFYQPPLYPVLLALLFRAGLTSAWSIAITQSALGAATAALMTVAGHRLAERGSARVVGLATGLATAAYGPLVLFDVEVLPPSIALFLFACALVLALRSVPLGALDAGIGLSLGTAVTGWPLMVLLAPGLCALRVRRLATRRDVARLVLLTFLCAPAPILLTARHNAQHEGQGVLISYNSGINLWLGNNPRWRDTWRARPGAAFEQELERPDREGATRPGERSSYFVQRVMHEVAARPGAAAARTAEKFYYVWHGREIRRNEDIVLLRETSPVLAALLWEAALMFPFGLLAPLAWLAIWRRRREGDIRILACSMLAYAAVLATFFVASRYRLPLVLLLLPLAVAEARALISSRKRALGRSLPLLASVVALNWPNEFTQSFAADAAERGILYAQAWRNQGRPERAAALSASLVERFPRDANVQMLRAETLVAQGRCDVARRHLRNVTELAPRASTPWVMLGTCLDELGDPQGAERAFATALSLHPYHPLALKRAGYLYARHGRTREARSLFERFVRSGYRDPEIDERLHQLSQTP